MTLSIIVCATFLSAVLIRAAWGDIRARDIPDWISIALVALAPLWWWASGVPSWSALGTQLGVTLALFLLFYGIWRLGMIGGGDVKLLAALSLWFAPLPLMNLLIVMVLAGGVVSLLAGVIHLVRRAKGRAEVPYGVAIAFAGLWAMTNEILTISMR